MLWVQGKRVVVVDDSIVRGTTSSKIVRLIKEAGATEVHMRIASPPMIASCYYGVDTPSRNVSVGAGREGGVRFRLHQTARNARKGASGMSKREGRKRDENV